MLRKIFCMLMCIAIFMTNIAILPVAAAEHRVRAEMCYNGNRYILFDNTVAWHEAVEKCRELGGHMVSVTSAEENAALKNFIQKGALSYYWLGSNDIQTEGKWVWESGEEWKYANWNSGEPNDSNGEDCGAIIKSSGQWNDLPDSYTAAGYICEIERTVVASGSCGDNASWTLDDEGMLLITGTGAIKDAGIFGLWYDYIEQIKSVVVGTGITHVGEYAFITLENMTEVTLPETLVSIGNSAFYLCTSLKKIRIPDSVTTIGDSAFCGCHTLEEVILPKNLTSIGSMMFMESFELKRIFIPSTVKTVESLAFHRSGITEVNYGGTEAQWAEVVIDDELNDALLSATVHCCKEDSSDQKGWSAWSTEYPKLQDNVKKRTEYSYKKKSTTTSSSSSMSGWTPYNHTTSYGNWNGTWLDYNPGSSATQEVKTSSEAVYKTQYYYERYVFTGTNSDNKRVQVTHFCMPTASLYYSNITGQWLDSIQLDNRLTAGSGWVHLSGCGCYYTSIYGRATYEYSYNGKKYYNERPVTVFSHNKTVYQYRPIYHTYYYYKWSDWSAWSATAVTANDTTEVQTRTVYSYQMTAEEPSISEKEQYNGTVVTLSSTTPDAIIYYTTDGTEPDENSKVYDAPVRLIESCTLKAIAASEGYLSSGVVSKDYVIELGDVKYLEFNHETGEITKCLPEAVSVTIPSEIDGVDVVGIGEYAFDGCDRLEKVVIPQGVTGIEKYAFNNCSKLTEIHIPDTVETIGEYAFSGCSALTEIKLPDSISSLGTRAFSRCSGLASIAIPSGVSVIEPYTFEENTSLAEVVIPESVVTIGDYAFTGCSALPEINIPKGVVTIGKGAFANCSSMKTATIPESVTNFGESVFAFIRNKVTIKCYLDTPAQQYAVEDSIKYELIPWGVLEKPTFVKNPIQGGATVMILAAKGKIYYTDDGSEPTVLSKEYKSPLSFTRTNKTIKAIAVETGWTNSEVAEFYTDVKTVATPKASLPDESKVSTGTKIELFCETDEAEIWCTSDGYSPTSSDVYEGPITITEDTTIMAVAVKDGMFSSKTGVFDYYISNAEDTPVVETLEATDITENSARVSAEVDAKNGTILGVYFEYYEKNNSLVKYTVEADKNNSAVMTGLIPDTEYWYKARAINEKGWSEGHLKIFKTDAQGIIKPASISIEPSYISMNVGKKKTLLATVLPESADNRQVYWSSEDKTVATVDENGIVTAVGLGNTRIKATTVSNRLVAYCNVDVISSDVRGEFNFSEHNMLTNSSRYDVYGYDHGAAEGGNALMASAYLARWDGAVLEENDPYPYPATEDNIKYRELEAEYHVQNIIYLPYKQDDLDNNEIKKALMEYGAVYTAFKVNFNYFDSSQTNYYLPSNVNAVDNGHAVVIVGWDDNYSRTNFVKIPPGDGAFICKNSWGTSSGENGYFYVSYYDKFMARPGCGDMNAVFNNAESVDNYNKIYQYDYLGPVSSYSTGTKVAYTANVFPPEGSVLAQNEQLKAVSFYNYSPGVPYEVYVIPDFQDKSSLKAPGYPVKSGVSKYAGYSTVNLDEAIELKAGTRFAVIVKYASTDGAVEFFVELPVKMADGSPHSSNAKANPGESYISTNGRFWEDFTDYSPNTNFCIKAFTDTDSEFAYVQAIDNEGREYVDDTVFTIEELDERGFSFNDEFIEEVKELENESSVNVVQYVFGSAAPTVYPDLTTNHKYSQGAALPARYDLREEECLTSVKHQGTIGGCWSFATYASLESTLKKSSYNSGKISTDGLNQSTASASSISLNTTGAMIAVGNSLQLNATVLPLGSEADVVWSSDNGKVVSVTAHGLIYGVGTGTAYVTASTADGKVSATCAVTVTAPAAVSAVRINNPEESMVVGEKLLMDYTVYPENAGDKAVTWSVDNTSAAQIDEYGMLTAVGGGTVTVTAYSADKTVAGSYTVLIDDGMACSAEITENDLAVYGNNIFGDLSSKITNKTSDSMYASVYMSVYDSAGRQVYVQSQNVLLNKGENTVDFAKVYIPGLNDTEFTVRIFVWADDTKMIPLAAEAKSEIR